MKLPFQAMSNSNLGVEQSSSEWLPSLNNARPYGQAGLQLYANIANGNLVVKDKVFRIMDRGRPLEFGPVYNSKSKSDSPWRFNSTMSIDVINEQSCIVTHPDGHKVTFSYDESSKLYVAKGGVQGDCSIEDTKEGFIWTQYNSGEKAFFDRSGKQQSWQDAQGHKQSFCYDDKGQLTSIKGDSGQTLDIEYKGNKINLYHNKKHLLASYERDAKGNLKKTTIPLDSADPNKTYTTDYNYDEAGLLESIEQTDQTKINFGYDKQARLANIIDGENRKFTFDMTNYGQVHITDNAQNKTSYTFDENKKLRSVIHQGDNNTSQEHKFDYDEHGRLEALTSPDKRQTEYRYNGVSLPKSREQEGQKQESYYDAETHMLISQVVDPEGKALTHYFVHDSKNQLSYEISPSGAVVAHFYDSKGDRVQSRKFTNAQIDTGAFSKDKPVDRSILDKWCSSKQHLHKSQLIEYVYDNQGQQLKEIHYATLDENGNGVFDKHTSCVETTRNIFGQILTQEERQTATKTNVSEFQYDGLHRPIYKKNALGAETKHQYEKNKITTIQPNKREDVQTLDSSGLIAEKSHTDSENKVTRTIKHEKDIAGNVHKVIDATGQTKTIFYDNQNRPILSIDEEGYAIERRYDVNGNLSQTVRYDKQLKDPEEVTSVSDVLNELSGSQKNSVETKIYNTQGLLKAEIDGEGYIKTCYYDSANRKVMEIQHAESLSQHLSLDKLDSESLDLIQFSKKDRVSYFQYNNDNHLIAKQDSGGYVTEFKRNNLGQIIEEIQYADKVKIELNFKPKASDKVKDIHSYFYYNAKGERIGKVDGEGYLEEYQYSANGLRTHKIRYANRVSTSNLDQPLGKLRPKSSDKDRHWKTEYDALNRERLKELPNGLRLGHEFDVMGNKTHEYQMDGSNEQSKRSRRFKHNSFGDCEKELTPRAIEIIESKQGKIDKNAWDNYAIKHKFSENGLHLSTTDALGNKTLNYYNKRRQIVAQIDATGGIKEKQYAAKPESIAETREYKNTFNPEELKKLEGGFITDDVRKQINDKRDKDSDILSKYEYNKRHILEKMTDAEGKKHVWQHNAWGEEEKYTKPISKNKSTTRVFERDNRGLVKKEIRDASAEGFKYETTHEYDAQKNQKLTIDPLCKEINFKRDKLGRIEKQIIKSESETITKETEWDAFSKISETNSLGHKTEFETNLNTRKQKITTPEGHRTTTTKNAFGETIETEHIASGEDSSTKKSHEYYKDGKLKESTDELENTTKYERNINGWKTKELRPNGLDIAFKHDQVGRVTSEIIDPDGEKITHQTFYDGRGLKRLTVNPEGTVEVCIFDKIRRLAKTFFDPDKLNYIHERSYQGTNIENDIQRTEDNKQKYHVKNEFDSLNRHTAKIAAPNSLRLTTRIFYDANDKKIAEQDPNGNFTRFIRDGFGRERFRVYPTGEVIRYDYDTENQLIRERSYSKKIDASVFSNQTTAQDIENIITETESSDDQIDTFVYDSDGNKRFKIDAKCNVIEWRYNSLGLNSESISHAFPIPHQLLSKKNLTPEIISRYLPSNAYNRHQHFIYDKANQCRFEVDADCFVKETQYDSAGNKIKTIRYANAIDISDVKKITPEAVTDLLGSHNSSNNRVEHRVFDKLNRLRFEVNEAGFVIEYGHNKNGAINCERHYAQFIAIPKEITPKVEDIQSLLKGKSSDQDNIISYKLDSLDRKQKKIDGSGRVQEFSYTILNKLDEHTDENGLRWKNTYDAAQRKVREKSEKIPAQRVTQQPDGSLKPETVMASISTKNKLDNNGNILKATFGKGPDVRSVESEFDARNRKIETTVKDVLIDDLKQDIAQNKRPETKANVTTKKHFNGKGKCVAEQDENGNWHFQVYDHRNLKRFDVNHKGQCREYRYNAFDNEIETIRYAKLLKVFDPNKIGQNGLTEHDVLCRLQEDPNNDRAIKTEYNRRNLKKLKLEPERFVYHPTENGVQQGLSNPTTIWEYNGFGELLIIKRHQDPEGKEWVRDLTIRDIKNHRTIHIDPANYVTVIENDYRGKPVKFTEYANSLPESDYTKMSAAKILSSIKLDKKDRVKSRSYDSIGRIISETEENVVVQDYKYVDGKPVGFEDLPPRNLTTTWKYYDKYVGDSTDSKIAKDLSDKISLTVEITTPDNKKYYRYFSKRHNLIAESKPERMGLDNNYHEKNLTPLTIHGYNIHNEEVIKTQFADCKKADANGFELAPSDGTEKTTLSLRDNRGLVIAEQDPENALVQKSHTKTKRVARQWQSVTQPNKEKQAKDKHKPDYVKQIRENRNHYDEVGQSEKVVIRQDNKDFRTKEVKRNNFNEIIAERAFGLDEEENKKVRENDLWPVYHKHDKGGYVWLTNEDKGIPTIHLQNASKIGTLQVQSQHQDLGKVKYKDIEKTVNQGPKQIQKTEYLLDEKNRIVGENKPIFQQHQCEALQTVFTVGKDYPKFGKYSITWPEPDGRFLVAEFKIRPKGSSDKFKPIEIKTIDNRCGVDATDLMTDNYEYHLTYSYKDPQTGAFAPHDYSKAHGELQLITEHNDKTRNLIIEMQDESTLLIGGNTKNEDGIPLSGVELINKAGEVIARVAASQTDKEGIYTVNLEEQITGAYRARPVYGYKQQLYKYSVQSQLCATKFWFGRCDDNNDYFNYKGVPLGCKSLVVKYGVGSNGGDNYLENNELKIEKVNGSGRKHMYFDYSKRFVYGSVYGFEKATQKYWYLGEVMPDSSLKPYTPNFGPANQTPFVKIPSPLLYIKPSQQVEADAVYATRGDSERLIAVSPWMNGLYKSSDILNFKNKKGMNLQLLQLAPQSVKELETQEFTIYTKHKSTRLMPRPICVEKFAASTKRYHHWGHKYRYIWFAWKLNSISLNKKPLHLAFRTTTDSPNYKLYLGRGGYDSDNHNRYEHAGCSIYQNGYGAYNSNQGNKSDSVARVSLSLMIDGDEVPILSSLPNGKTEKIEKRTLQYVTTFYDKQFNLYFSPLPEQTHKVRLQYLSQKVWKDLDATVTKHGAAINVTPVSPGLYRYRIQVRDKYGELIDLSGIVNSSDEDGWAYGEFKAKADNNQYISTPDKLPEKWFHPKKRQKRDRWGNPIEVTDERGNKSKYEVNHRNQIVKRTDPAVKVTNEHGKDKVTPLETFYGFNIQGKCIGKRKPNGAAQLNILNSVGQLIKFILANGVTTLFKLDGFNRQLMIINGLNHATKQKFNRNDQITETIDPEGCTTKTQYNEAKERLSFENGEGEANKFGHNACGELTTIVHPSGHKHEAEYHHSGQPSKVTKANGASQSWQRDHFGHPVKHKDFGGALISFEMNHCKQVTHQKSTGGNHGQHYDDNNELVSVTNQDIRNKYNEAGFLIQIADRAMNLLSDFFYNISGRRVGERFRNSDGDIYQDINLELDALNRVIRLFDTRVVVYWGYDENNNRRYTKVWARIDGVNKQLSRENWYLYDPADFLVIDRGVPKDRIIQITKDQGTKLGYDDAGQRNKEITLDKHGKVIKKSLTYFKNGLLHRTKSSNGKSSIRKYDKAHRNTYFKDDKTSRGTRYNKHTGLMDFQSNVVDGYSTHTDYFRDKSGLVNREHSETDYHITEVHRDHTNFSSQLPGKVSGHCIAKPQGINSSSTSKEDECFVRPMYTANGQIESIEGRLKDGFRKFIVNNEARIVVKIDGNDKERKAYYFYMPGGQAIGRIGNLPKDDLKRVSEKDLEVDFDLNFRPVSRSFPAPAPSEYAANGNETFNQISENVYGDASFGDVIAHANSYDVNTKPPQGMPLQIPNLLSTHVHNQAGQYAVYNPSTIVGGLYPDMPIPPIIYKKPHHNYWKDLIEVVAIAVDIAAIASTGGLASGLAVVMGKSLLTYMVAGAIAGAAGDLAKQGIEDAGHIHNGINTNELLRSTVSGAASGGFNYELPLPKDANLWSQAWRNGARDIMNQGIDRLAFREHMSAQIFIADQLGAVAGTESLQSKTFHGFLVSNVVQQFVRTTSVNLFHYSVQDVESMVVNSIGVSLGQYGHKVSEDAWTRYRSEHKKTTPQPHKAHVSNHRSTLFGKNHSANQNQHSATSPSENAFWKKQIEEMNKREYIREVERFNKPVKKYNTNVERAEAQTRNAFKSVKTNTWWSKIEHAIGDIVASRQLTPHQASAMTSITPISLAIPVYSTISGEDWFTGEPVSRTISAIESGVGLALPCSKYIVGGVRKIWDVGRFGVKSSGLYSRTRAAEHVSEARNLLKELGLTPSQRNEILYSFDLETFRVEHVLESRYEYRLFDDGAAKLQGRYVSPHFLENQTDRIVKFALPKNSATRLGNVNIPQGSVVFTGRVAPQVNLTSGLVGGESQTFLMGPLDGYTFEETLMPRETIKIGSFNGNY